MSDTTITTEPGTPFIDVVREFDASAKLLLRAHTEADLLARWLGPRELTMTVHELDARNGGGYRYTHRDADGNEFGFRGVFHGDPSTSGLVQTFEFDGAPGHISLEFLVFEEHNGKTVRRSRSVFRSVEDRDAIVASGMEHGMNDSFARLDQLVAELG